MKKRLFPLILALVFSLSLSVLAHEVPDLTQNGTITFEIQWQGEPLDGGELAIYRVGDVVESDGNYGFSLIDRLADSGLSLENPDDPALARKLSELAAEAELEPLTAPIEDGEACFVDVAPGLYVVVQTQACDGFAELNPFLISMPRYENETYVTDVVAKPKVPLETEPTEPEPTRPTEPTPPSLPQTGQLNWPVPLLAALGLLFFTLGWALCFGRKRTADET